MPLKLLERAKADIPRIEQLEKDHPRMARLFQKGLLPYHVWEQLLEAEQVMDAEVNTVQAEAELTVRLPTALPLYYLSQFQLILILEGTGTLLKI